MLFDTNILYSIFFKQNDFKSSWELLSYAVDFKETIYINQFTIYSFAMGCCKKKQEKTLDRFNELLKEQIFDLISLNNFDIPEVFKFMKEYDLDFDDALHAFLAKKHRMSLITFDKDFDRVNVEHYTPREWLKRG